MAVWGLSYHGKREVCSNPLATEHMKRKCRRHSVQGKLRETMPERVRGGGAGGVTIRSDTHADHTTCTKLTTTNALQQQMRFINFLLKNVSLKQFFQIQLLKWKWTDSILTRHSKGDAYDLLQQIVAWAWPSFRCSVAMSPGHRIPGMAACNVTSFQPHWETPGQIYRDNMAQDAQIHRNRLDSFILG